jgi:glycosyltransferase involved in cell wall biosynthesis
LVTGRPANRKIATNPPQGPTQIHWIDESRLLGRTFTGRAFRKTLSGIIADDPARTLIHDHGLWLPSNHAAAEAAHTHRVTQVVSVRGMLSPWALKRRRIRKAVLWRVRQRLDLFRATAFHATSELEVNQIRSAGFSQPIALIPNGIRVPHEMPLPDQVSHRRMLLISRLHPVKGLENLLHAFQLACSSNDWELWLAGPSETGYRESLRRLSSQLGVSQRVQFLDEVDDDEKWKLYASADRFVLPSFSENFGISIAEALAAGVPVITTTGTPWSELVPRGAGWWVEPSVQELTMALREATQMSPVDLRVMGARGRDWVRCDFVWDSVAERMCQFYQWLLLGGSKPACVI